MSVVAAPGFDAAAAASGVKPGGALDVALVATSDRQPVTAAGVFTCNRVASAPVQISRQHLADRRASAVVLNAGNANAATGEPGREHARRMCATTAAAIGCDEADVLVCSTGLIGVPLPVDLVEAGIGTAAPALADDDAAGHRAADAIRTTDTVLKEATITGAGCTVGGMAKGAAMLAPAMATMLAVVTTDAAVTAPALDAALGCAVHDTFNALIVDADRRHDGDELLAQDSLEDGGVDAADVPDEPEPLVALLDGDQAGVLPREPDGVRAVAVQRRDDLAVHLADEGHANDVDRVGVGDAEPVDELGLLAQAAHELADLGAAAVDDHGVHPDEAHEHHVLGEQLGEAGLLHGVAAVLDDDRAAGELPDVRERLREHRGLRRRVEGALVDHDVPRFSST